MSRRVAITYAKAFVSATREKGHSDVEADRLCQQVKDFAQSLKSHGSVMDVLCSPGVSLPDREQLLQKLLEKSAMDSLAKNFLLLLLRKRRMESLLAIADSLDDVQLDMRGGLRGFVESSEQLSDADLAALTSAFAKKLGRTVEFRTTVRSDLLAGVKVEVQGVTYDGTLAGQLNKLKESILKGSASAGTAVN